MASHARYERAPQRDSLEETADAYAQHPPPPSYQATAAEFEPRSEGDNVPDDFKVSSFSRWMGLADGLECYTGWELTR